MNVKLKLLSTGVIFFTGGAIMAQVDSTKTSNIDEVVIVAYGVQKKSTLTGSNVQIDSKQLENRPISNVLQALDGAGAGIQIAAGTGQPGDGASIRIRGAGSYLVSTEPLIIVDGVPFPGELNSLNPNDIESLNVLKDAASTALYGSSAANGVIMVTTKRGKKNSSRFTLNSSTGIVSRFVKEYERVGPADYYVLAWEAMRNGRRITNSGETLAASNLWATNNLISGNLKANVYNVPNNQLVVDGMLNPGAQLLYNDFDWADAIVNVGLRQDHSISFSGGNDKSTVFSSLGYTKENGYIIKSDFERLNLRINADSQVRNWLKIGTSLNGSITSSGNAVDGADNNSSYINPYAWTRGIGPIYSPYQHDPITGERLYDVDGNVLYDNGASRGADAAVGRNVVWETILNENRTNAYNMQSNVYAEFKLLPELRFRTNAAYNFRGTLNKTYGNKLIGDELGRGSATRTMLLTRDFTWNQLLTYNKDFGNHGITVLAGHENFDYKRDYLYGSKRDQVLNDFYEFGNFVENTTINSYLRERTKESWFSRVNYDFAEKYLLEGSIRWDASSRFATDVRWQSFWSAGAGWVISKENFLKDNKFVNFLKLRGSYGEIGNDDLDTNYAYQTFFSLGYNNSTEPGVLLTKVGDPAITWETKVQSDVALEFELFNRRIRGTVEYYNSRTDALLFPFQTPINAGIPGNNIDRNVGDLINKGYELTLSADVIKNKDIKWTLTAYGTSYKNEITRLSQNELITGTKKVSEGKDLYAFWLRTWYGVDPADGSPLFVLDQSLYTDTSATDVRTVNGVLVTTNQNKAKYDYHGSAIPDFFGNFSTTFNYKNWELSASFNYQFGGKIYDTNYASLMDAHPQGGALHTDILNRWTTPGQITDVPALNSATAAASNAGSSRWLVDASYVMLRNAALGYNFNPDIVKSVGVSSLKLFVSGENLWLSSKRKGLEPYSTFNGTVSNRYSPSRIITFGLSTTF
ncbi:SusC/RagA family TonB-linked outer membrane protein [Chryseobacterium indoltheticum]|jgi:TonB-linked SusC/RagA family outer membrane protein|uniref:SusC/RagA family TonB-linked outer membrane protein n=1 Tax=Chryseobacterium indoltheticum TaxID=254 RepID=UPI002430D068|nr:SusC/RagA family TonB-linked outer membrane protein [Chryseobacterium indoltheticum]MDF2833989.1 putative outer membrane protein involved in nutrient binding [Chryseobacterium indoltheticum]